MESPGKVSKRDNMKKGLKIFAINIAVLILFLVALEIILRLAGMETLNGLELEDKGWQRKYKKICQAAQQNKLKFYNAFYTDSSSIYRANPQFNFDSLERYPGVSVNAAGFRGSEFEPVDTKKTKILLVGDSYTWGAAAKPFTNSFADLIREAGYHVYNAGIPGTDPIQYANVLKKFVPLLKPDLAAVCLYLGNDVKRTPQVVAANKNLRYLTNYGMLRGFDDKGNHFNNAREALEYLKKRKCGYCKSLWAYFLHKTVIGRGIYEIINKNKLVTYKDNKWVTDTLKGMQSICEKNGCRFFLFLIPVVKRNETKRNSLKDNIHLFKELPHYHPENLQEADYQEPPNSHFNNRGHRKYADFIIEILKKEGYPPLKEENPDKD